MCKSSNKALRIAIAQQQAATEAARKQSEAALKQQKKLQEQALSLQKKQLKFQQQQADYAKKKDAKVEELANRPAPPPPPPAAVVVTGGSAGMASAEDNTQSALDSRKRGRAALRIDLNAPQTAGGTGLNVPRG